MKETDPFPPYRVDQMASQNPDFQLSLLIGKIRTPNNSQSTKINIILPCVNTSITTATTKRYLWTLLTSTCLSLSLQDEKLHEKSLEIWKMRKREEVPRYSGLNRRKEQTGKSRWLYTTLRYVLHQLKEGEEDEFRSVFRGSDAVPFKHYYCTSRSVNCAIVLM